MQLEFLISLSWFAQRTRPIVKEGNSLHDVVFGQQKHADQQLMPDRKTMSLVGIGLNDSAVFDFPGRSFSALCWTKRPRNKPIVCNLAKGQLILPPSGQVAKEYPHNRRRREARATLFRAQLKLSGTTYPKVSSPGSLQDTPPFRR